MAPQGSGAADLAQITVRERGDSRTPQELAGRGTRARARGAGRCSCSRPEAGRRPALGHKGGKETSPPRRRPCCEAADPVLPTDRRALGTGSPEKARRRGRRESDGVGERWGRRAPGWQPRHGRGRSRRCQRSVPSRGCRETWVSLEPALPCPAQPGDGLTGVVGEGTPPPRLLKAALGADAQPRSAAGTWRVSVEPSSGRFQSGLARAHSTSTPKRTMRSPSVLAKTASGGRRL